MTKKKYLLAIGSLVTIAAPMTAVISCGSNSDNGTKKVIDGEDLQTESNKLQNFTTVDKANDKKFTKGNLGEEVTLATMAKGRDVTTNFKNITEVKAAGSGGGKPLSAALKKGVTINFARIKTAYNTTSRQIVFTVALTMTTDKPIQNDSKEITVTFAA